VDAELDELKIADSDGQNNDCNPKEQIRIAGERLVH
jgi:hypothetical protein